MTPQKSTSLLILVLAGLMLLVTGCSDDDVTAPAPTLQTGAIASDPLDDVLKSTDGRTPADPIERCARLGEVLGLDDDQLAALTMAYTGFRDGMAELRTEVMNHGMTMADARDAARDLRNGFEAEMQIILTAAQWDQLQDMRHEGRQDDGHHRGGGGHHQGPGDLWGSYFEEIGVDAGQIAAIIEALYVLQSGMQDLRDQMHDGTLTYEEAHEAAEALRADFDAALQSILTEEQYQALLDLRPDCGGRQGG